MKVIKDTSPKSAGGSFGTWVVGRPRRMLCVALCVTAILAALIPGLGVSTSRYGLVARDEPVQQKLLDFFERFGYPDLPIMVVQGASFAQRRAFVEVLSHRLEAIESLKGRVLFKFGAENMAELISLIYKQTINSSAGQSILKEMFGLPVAYGNHSEYINCIPN